MRIEVWGALRVTRGDVTMGPKDFSGLKPKQLLQILVAERGHAVSKARLAELLWTDTPPLNHVATLETHISVLRQVLEPGVRARDSVIVTERAGYLLDVSRIALDLVEFDELVLSSARRQPVEALEALDAALTLVRGPLFEDEPDAEWAEALRGAYAQRHVQVLVDAGRLALMTGEAAAALSRAQQAVALDPLAEAGYQVLMTASYALWRQEDALRAFDQCRRLLAEELGVDPMDETVALHLAILRHEDVAGLTPRAAVRPDTVGPGSAPVATAAGAVEEALNVRVPGAESVGLLGREAELRQIEDALAHAVAGHFSLLLVVGGSGLGKTRLVEAVMQHATVPVGANRCSDLEAELPYVALSLALRPVLQRDGDSAMPVVTELLRRADRAEPFDTFARLRAMESLAEVVERSGPFLLVLDDAQWADPETVATLGYLARRCPTVPVAVLLTCDRGGLAESLKRLPLAIRIDLEELSAADLSALGDTVFDLTRGHPLFVTDWLEASARGLPDGFTPQLRERVITQCWDLGPQAYRLLTVAALLDQPFSPALLAHLVGASDDVVEELDRLVEEHLLVPEGEEFRFRHELVARILADMFSAARGDRLRKRAAEFRKHPPAAPQQQRRRRSTDMVLDGGARD